jgi:hypothetical protein
LGKTVALGLIDQDKFKLTFINKPTKPFNLEKEPSKMAVMGKYMIMALLASILLGPCSIYVIPFAIGLCLINILARLISSHLHAIMLQIMLQNGFYPLLPDSPMALSNLGHPYNFTP